MFLRHLLTRFGILLLALMLMVSSGPVIAQDSPEMADEIRVSVVAGAMQDTMMQLVEKYQDANPGVTVTLELEPEGGAFQALIAAGNQPDLIITSFGPMLGTLSEMGATVQLDNMPGADELFSRIEPLSLEKLYGHYYYVPIGADVTLMIYNKALFEEAGLDPEAPPVTWDEFLAAAEAIDALPTRSNGDEVYGTVFWNEALQWGGWYWNMLQPIYLNANQGECQLLNNLATNIIFDRPECNLEGFFEFTRAAQLHAPATMEKNFFGRNIGMWLQYGYSWQPNLLSAAGDPMVIGEDVGVAPVPVPNEGDTSFTTFGGRSMMILKTSPEREARAWDFLQFLMEEENNFKFITELGYLPVLTALKDDPYFQTPDRLPFVQLLEHGYVPEQFAAAERAASALQGVYQGVVVEGSVPLDDAVGEAASAARDAIQSQ
ncbi:MAG: extracellular solute-binding protein [Anaerolineales bacterium]|nr:extracellular solute-binding protein [Anaerolineales bacterium]